MSGNVAGGWPRLGAGPVTNDDTRDRPHHVSEPDVPQGACGADVGAWEDGAVPLVRDEHQGAAAWGQAGGGWARGADEVDVG